MFISSQPEARKARSSVLEDSVSGENLFLGLQTAGLLIVSSPGGGSDREREREANSLASSLKATSPIQEGFALTHHLILP